MNVLCFYFEIIQGRYEQMQIFDFESSMIAISKKILKIEKLWFLKKILQNDKNRIRSVLLTENEIADRCLTTI